MNLTGVVRYSDTTRFYGVVVVVVVVVQMVLIQMMVLSTSFPLCYSPQMDKVSNPSATSSWYEFMLLFLFDSLSLGPV